MLDMLCPVASHESRLGASCGQRGRRVCPEHVNKRSTGDLQHVALPTPASLVYLGVTGMTMEATNAPRTAKDGNQISDLTVQRADIAAAIAMLKAASARF